MFVKCIFSVFISLGLLHGVSGATITTSAGTTDPTVAPACTEPTFGGFALYAQRTDTKAKYPVRLLSTGDADTTHMVVSTNDTCPTSKCGEQPGSWTLTKRVVTVNLADTPATKETINLAVSSGQSPSFVTATIKKAQPYPVYCAVTSPSTSTTAVTRLAVNGTPSKFTMCAWTSIVPYPTVFSITYDRSNIQPVGVSCFPVNLIMQRLIPIEPGPA